MWMLWIFDLKCAILFHLGVDYVKLVPFAVAIGAVLYSAVRAFRKDTSHHINKSIQKDQAKVATMVNAEELGETTAFCRCWKSKKVGWGGMIAIWGLWCQKQVSKAWISNYIPQ